MLKFGLEVRAERYENMQSRQSCKKGLLMGRTWRQGIAVGVSLLAGLMATGGAQASTTQVRESGFAYDATTGILNQEVVQPNDSEYRLQTDYIHDAFGNVVSAQVSGLGIATRSATSTYDAKGRFSISSTNELGHTDTTTFDEGLGVPLVQTGPNGLTATFAYDVFGRKVSQTGPDGTQIRWTYEYCVGIQNGTATCATNKDVYVLSEQVFAADGTTPLGPKNQTYFDRLDRERASETQGLDGRIIRKEVKYDNLGRKVKESKPYFVGDPILWTKITYDAISRVASVKSPDNSTMVMTQTALTTTKINDLGQVEVVERNMRNQEVRKTDANGQVMTFLYDPSDNVVQVTGVTGNVTINEFDLMGRRTASLDPNMGYWTYDYDVLGQMLQQTDAKGQTKTVSYDLLGRMVSRVEPDLSSTWTYDTATDGIGKLASTASDNGYAKSVTYDSLGRPTQESTTVLGETATFSTYYDTHGRVENLAYPTGYMVRQVYSSLGFLERVEDVSTNGVLWQADTANAEGNITQETAGNGIQTTRTYNPYVGGITSVKAGVAATVADLDFTFDSIGNIVQRRDLAQAVTETFQYDVLNRLTEYAIAGGVTKTVTYDVLGNITSKSDVGTYAYASNNPHQITSISGIVNTSYAYDANGNTLAGNGRTYEWNSFNKILTVQRGANFSSMDYDSAHTRMREVTNEETTVYFRGAGLRAEKVTGASSGNSVWKLYLEGGGKLIGQRIEAGATTTISYFVADHLGSIAVIMDELGGVKERLAYDAWGKRRYPDGSDDPTWSITSESSRGFTGHEHMDEVGLINMNARLYDAQVGRFVSPDPFIQSVTDSQSYNRYAYVRNNPLSYTDPTGNFWGMLAAFFLAPSQWDVVKDFIANQPELAAVLRIAATYYFGVPGAVVSSAYITQANGGSFKEIVVSGLTAAAQAMIAKSIGLGTGNGPGQMGEIGAVVAHAASGCFFASASGGGSECASGAASAAFTHIAGPHLPKGEWQTPLSGALFGGVSSVLGGGKFINGAITGAFTHMLNNCKQNIGCRAMEKMWNQSPADYWNFVVDINERSGGVYFMMVPAGAALKGVQAAKYVYGSVKIAMRSGLTLGQLTKATRTALSAKHDTTAVGHAFAKHVNRSGGKLWGKLHGTGKDWTASGMKHYREILRGPGAFKKTVNDRGIPFLDKRLPDHRGVRLQMDHTFKGFID